MKLSTRSADIMSLLCNNNLTAQVARPRQQVRHSPPRHHLRLFRLLLELDLSSPSNLCRKYAI